MMEKNTYFLQNIIIYKKWDFFYIEIIKNNKK